MCVLARTWWQWIHQCLCLKFDIDSFNLQSFLQRRHDWNIRKEDNFLTALVHWWEEISYAAKIVMDCSGNDKDSSLVVLLSTVYFSVPNPGGFIWCQVKKRRKISAGADCSKAQNPFMVLYQCCIISMKSALVHITAYKTIHKQYLLIFPNLLLLPRGLCFHVWSVKELQILRTWGSGQGSYDWILSQTWIDHS